MTRRSYLDVVSNGTPSDFRYPINAVSHGGGGGDGVWQPGQCHIQTGTWQQRDSGIEGGVGAGDIWYKVCNLDLSK